MWVGYFFNPTTVGQIKKPFKRTQPAHAPTYFKLHLKKKKKIKGQKEVEKLKINYGNRKGLSTST